MSLALLLLYFLATAENPLLLSNISSHLCVMVLPQDGKHYDILVLRVCGWAASKVYWHHFTSPCWKGIKPPVAGSCSESSESRSRLNHAPGFVHSCRLLDPCPLKLEAAFSSMCSSTPWMASCHEHIHQCRRRPSCRMSEYMYQTSCHQDILVWVCRYILVNWMWSFFSPFATVKDL